MEMTASKRRYGVREKTYYVSPGEKGRALQAGKLGVDGN